MVDTLTGAIDLGIATSYLHDNGMDLSVAIDSYFRDQEEQQPDKKKHKKNREEAVVLLIEDDDDTDKPPSSSH